MKCKWCEFEVEELDSCGRCDECVALNIGVNCIIALKDLRILIKANRSMKEQLELGFLAEVRQERESQKEKWSTEHDDTHDQEELAIAASCYAFPWSGMPWPFAWPTDRPMIACSKRKRLVIAGALLMAEIERMDREV